MGSAHLTITRPAPAPPTVASAVSNNASPGSPGAAAMPRPVSRAGLNMAAAAAAAAAQGAEEKRILVHGKTQGEVLLDVCLDESRFERVASRGIAVSVWEDARGPNGEVGVVGAKGGVVGGRVRVYMIQVCSFTFGGVFFGFGGRREEGGKGVMKGWTALDCIGLG